MTFSTVSRRPGGAAPAEGPPPELPVRPPLRRARAAPSGRRVPAGAAVGSLLVHAVLGVLAVAFLRFGPAPGEGPAPAPPPREMVEYFDLAFPEGAAADPAAAGAAPGGAPLAAEERRDDPRRRERGAPSGPGLVFPTETPSSLPAPGTSGASGGAAEGGGSRAEGWSAGNPLRPGLRDARLHAPEHPAASPPPLTEHERYMERLGGRLEEYNDSVAGEAERARRGTDWTTTDKDGRRWGVSPGKIHLGGVTLPMPGLPDNAPQRTDEAREEARQRREIDRQVDVTRRQETLRDRIRATRERKDAERKKQKEGSRE